jgi:HPt (histidine-containing phosphotransfer) domain-containing protein
VIKLDINQEYVNVQDALKRIGGSMDLYKRLLKQFTGSDNIGPLEEALNAGAMDEAARLVHTLKGVAANLSLIKVSSKSSELEQSFHNSNDHSAIFAELKDAYDITSQEIAKIY